ncbi:hypothetical protein MNBD_IGNAVI01-674 [hydrothermal vent metagenome]|uniref:Uncharacterized protein n=1 Tax=hydrothermal vent metagenome TaxID=652676 RepID=A0A3B1BXG6_9ZZZZ
MSVEVRKINILWKFFFWPIVWISIFIPSYIWPIKLQGEWLIFARVFGAILFIYSMFLASSGGRTLARFAHQEAHETFWPDKFTTFGIFGCMRHPMHLGLAIFPISAALISGYVLAIFGSGWGVAAALWFIIQIEEKDTIKKYGEDYINYMQKVPPLSLKISCIKEAFKVW